MTTTGFQRVKISHYEALCLEFFYRLWAIVSFFTMIFIGNCFNISLVVFISYFLHSYWQCSRWPIYHWETAKRQLMTLVFDNIKKPNWRVFVMSREHLICRARNWDVSSSLETIASLYDVLQYEQHRRTRNEVVVRTHRVEQKIE